MAQSENEVVRPDADQAEPVVVAPEEAVAQVTELSETQAALAGLFTQLNNVSAGMVSEMRAMAKLGRGAPDAVLRELPRRLSGTVLKLCADGFRHMANVVVLFSTVEDRVAALEASSDLNTVASPDELFSYLHDVLELCTVCVPFMIGDDNKALLAQVQEQTEEFLARMAEDEEDPEDTDEPEAGGEGDEPAVAEVPNNGSAAETGKEGPDASNATT